MRLFRWPVIAAAVVLLTACTSQPDTTAPSTAPSTFSAPTSGSPEPAGSTTQVPSSTLTSTVRVTVTNSTVTRTATVSAGTVAPPPATKEPEPQAGPCPYLPEDDVKLINGQGYGPTMLTAVEPYPICDFYRSDGGWQARIRIVRAATPEAAEAAVDQHVPVDRSAPASRPAGWSGGSMTTPDGIAGNDQVRSVYAVSKGRTAIIAESNQDQTIKGRQMVIEVVENLGL